MGNKQTRLRLVTSSTSNVLTMHGRLTVGDYRRAESFVELVTKQGRHGKRPNRCVDLFNGLATGCDLDILAPELVRQVFLLCAKKVSSGRANDTAKRYARELWELLDRSDPE